MSINKTIKVEGTRDQVIADEHNRSIGKMEHDDIPAIDKSHASRQTDEGREEVGDYKGRKDSSDIDGPQQDSQETDEVYVDTRASSGLPPAGKNVEELNAFDLGRHDKD